MPNLFGHMCIQYFDNKSECMDSSLCLYTYGITVAHSH